MSILTFHDEVLLETVGATCVRLLSLDQLWTNRMLAGGSISDSDQKDLETLTAQIVSLLTEAVDQSRRFMTLLERSGEAVELSAHRSILGESWTDGHREYLRKMVHPDGITAYITRQLSKVIELADAEKRNVECKLRDLLEGHGSTGDLSKEFKCGVAASGFVAGLAGLRGPLPVMLFGAFVAGCCYGYAMAADC